MLGRIGCMLPLFMNNRPGSWFGVSVCIERMTHRSSMSAAVCGNRSLTSMPASPYWRCLNGDGRILPSRRLRPSAFTKLGTLWPAYLCKRGLGSNVSMCDGPPFMNRKMRCFARGVKCGGLRCERIAVIGQRWRGREQAGIVEHGGQADGAEAAADAGEDIAAGDRTCDCTWRIR